MIFGTTRGALLIATYPMADEEAIAAIAPNLQRYVSGDLTAQTQ